MPASGRRRILRRREQEDRIPRRTVSHLHGHPRVAPSGPTLLASKSTPPTRQLICPSREVTSGWWTPSNRYRDGVGGGGLECPSLENPQAGSRRTGTNLHRRAAHSLMQNGATAMAAAGTPAETIRRWGRWFSGCWRRYVSVTIEGLADLSRAMVMADCTLAMVNTGGFPRPEASAETPKRRRILTTPLTSTLGGG